MARKTLDELIEEYNRWESMKGVEIAKIGRYSIRELTRPMDNQKLYLAFYTTGRGYIYCGRMSMYKEHVFDWARAH